MPPRQSPSSPSLRRRGATRSPRGTIVVFCEGKITETRYLKAFVSDCENHLVKVEVTGGVGVPTTIVDRAVAQFKLLKKLSRKRGADSFDSVFSVWAVFDFDNHPNVPQAIDLGTRSGVHIGYSNPCFELWALLHFTESDRPLDRTEVQNELKRYMRSYDHARQPIFEFQLLKPHYHVAVGRAEAGRLRRREDRQERGNPSTSVDELLEEIRQFGVKPQVKKSQK